MDLSKKKEDTKDVSCPSPRIRINITDKTPLLRMDAPSLLRIEAPLEKINKAIKNIDNTLDNIDNTLEDITTTQKTDKPPSVKSRVYGPTLPPVTTILPPPVSVAVLSPVGTKEPPTPSVEKIVTFPIKESTVASRETPVSSPKQRSERSTSAESTSSSNTSVDTCYEPTNLELFVDWFQMFVDDFVKDCEDVFERRELKRISKRRTLELLRRRVGGMKLMREMTSAESILEEMQDSYVPPRKKKTRHARRPTSRNSRPKSRKPSTKTN